MGDKRIYYKYSKKIAEKVLTRMMAGESVNSICKDTDMPSRKSIYLWIVRHEEFAEQYERAQFIQAMGYVDEIIDIADNGSNDWMENNDENNPGWRYNGEHVQRSRLRVDSRKWIASKMLPKFSDKYDNSKEQDSQAQPVKVEIVVNDASAKNSDEC